MTYAALTKKCRKCKRDWPATRDFFDAKLPKRDGRSNGLEYYCRRCKNEALFIAEIRKLIHLKLAKEDEMLSMQNSKS